MIKQSLNDLKERLDKMKRNNYIVEQPSGISLFKQWIILKYNY